jgi:hypothetical protein
MTDREPTTPMDVPTGATAASAPAGPEATTPPYDDRPVALRRPDAVAALLLLLAGLAALISLPLRWLADDDLDGWDLVGRGFDEFGDLGDTGFWQPLAVVLGGAALFVLGLLMLLPARTHRFLGVVALAVTALVSAGVLVPLTQAGFDFGEFALGYWFAIAVAVLGLLGSLKALVTRPTMASQPAFG